MRKALGELVAAGRAVCCRCGRPIVPGSAWHADHTDDRSGYRGAAHAACNLRAAARKGAAVAARKGGGGATTMRL